MEPVLLAGGRKSEVRLVSDGLVVKRYLTPDAAERVRQDERSLRFLADTLGTITWRGWELRTVRVLGLGDDGRSIRLEHATGTVVARLAPSAMRLGEQLFGVWLGAYERRVLAGRDSGIIFTDLSLHNAIVDPESRHFIVLDPGKAFGRTGYVYEDILLHLESLVACAARRRLNPIPLIDAFLDGYVASRAAPLHVGHYVRSLVRTKRQMCAALLRRPLHLPLYAALSTATLPLWLWHVPRRLAAVVTSAADEVARPGERGGK